MTDPEIKTMAAQAHARYTKLLQHDDHEWLTENTYFPPRDCTITQLVGRICAALICAMRQDRFDPVADALVMLNILEEIPILVAVSGEESKSRKKGSA